VKQWREAAGSGQDSLLGFETITGLEHTVSAAAATHAAAFIARCLLAPADSAETPIV